MTKQFIIRFSFLATCMAAIACGTSVATSPATGSPTPSTSPTGNPTPTPTVTQSGPTPTPSATPKPTPTVTPAPAAVTCSVVWVSEYNDGTDDIYEVDVNASLWTSGTVNFDGVNAVGYYLRFYDPTANTFGAAGMTTAGAFSLNVAGTTSGDQVAFSDATDHTFWSATEYMAGTATTLGGMISDGGQGTFSGVLSAASSQTVTDGNGTDTINVNEAALEIFGGNDAADHDFAICQ